MKAYLRVAAVTAAMQELLLPAVQSVAPDGLIKTGIPFDGTRQKQFQGINLFLFQVERNASLANEDLATRSDNGTLLQVPVAAIDLHYLVTFYGDDAQLVPHKLLGAVVSMIHSWPVLSPMDLRRLAENNPGGVIDESGIADQVETVKLTQLPLGIEAMMRLWTVFQVPYALTVACRASVVLLDSLDPPDPPPLVRKIQIAVGPNPLPSMSMEPADLAVGDVLEVEVENAPVPAVDIAIGNAVAKPDTTAGAAARYKITPDLSKRLDLRSGSNPIRLVNNEGAPVAERSFTLRPTIQRVSRQTEARSPVPRPGEPRNFILTAVIVPRVAEGQTIGLTLTRVGNKGSESPVATSVSRSKDGDILASFQGVLPGVYRVTVTVSGATSKLLPMPRSGLPVDALQVS